MISEMPLQNGETIIDKEFIKSIILSLNKKTGKYLEKVFVFIQNKG
jgi:hypothetical protein